MSSKDTYVFEASFRCSTELRRLDRLHDAFTSYFGGRLSFAPLENAKTKAILDMGCGSGAWAIDAAKRNPQAIVIAIDANPLPSRSLPSNIQFKQLDLTEPFPFEKYTFDIVHARLVMLHLPEAVKVLKRSYDLLKPSGWLIVEEPDIEDIPAERDLPKMTQKAISFIRTRGGEPSIGRLLQASLESSGLFSEVNIKKVIVPLSGQHTDLPEGIFGMEYKETCLAVARSLMVLYADQGITPKDLEDYEKEMLDPSRALTSTLYFTWSKRSSVDM